MTLVHLVEVQQREAMLRIMEENMEERRIKEEQKAKQQEMEGSCKFLAKFRSFSAVSAPIFASKYAFCSIFQNLPDYLAEMF